MAHSDEQTPPPGFVAMNRLFEVEIRSLAGESWFVVPSGDRVADLRASIAMAAPPIRNAGGALFAEGQRLEDEEAALPSPPAGERLVVHLAPSAVEKCVEIDDEPTDTPDSPGHRDASSPHASPVVLVTGGARKSQRSRWQERVGWSILLIGAAIGAAASMTPRLATQTTLTAHRQTASSRGSSSELRASSQGKDPMAAAPLSIMSSRQLLVWGAGAITARLALDATSNNTKFSFTFAPPSSASSTSTVKRDAPPIKAAPAVGAQGQRAAPASPRPPLISISLSTSPSAQNEVAEPSKWQSHVMKALKHAPLASAALSLWRPVGRRLLALILVFAKQLLPAPHCAALIGFVKARGLAPRGFEGLEKACSTEVPATPRMKKMF